MSAAVATIGDIAVDLRSGFASGGDDPDGVVQFRMNNVGRTGEINWDKLRRVPRSKAKPHLMVLDGDILFNATNSPELVGKTALFSGFSEPVTFSNHFVRIRTKERVADPTYVARWLQCEFERGRFENMCRSWVNQASITRDQLASLSLPLPPLDEQRRIAAILDKADALRRKRKRAIELLDGLTRSIFLEMFGDPITNPRKLTKTPLGDLIKVKSGDGLVAKDMKDGRFSVYGGNGINGYHNEYMFEEPRLVIGRVGAYCGAVHLTKPNSWITDNALHVSEYKKPISIQYLRYALIEADLNQFAGRAAQPLVSGSRIYPVEILLPNDKEQLQFERAVSKVSHLENYLQENEKPITSLFSSLQSRAFSGQL